MQKPILIFMNSAGALLLILASALFLINSINPSDYVPPSDPVLLMPINQLFWIFGGIAAVVAMICLFSERLTMSIALLLSLTFSFLAYRVCFLWIGCHNQNAFLADFSYAFGLSPNTTNLIVDLTFAYLLIGGLVTHWLSRRLPPPVVFEKMPCPACGGRVRFPMENLGKNIECPACKANMTLRKTDQMLKMSCFFCKEHIEFPAHALGRKINCPHCKMRIGLKEENA